MGVHFTRVHFPDVLLFLSISNNLKFSYFFYTMRTGDRDEPLRVNARS
jgi:hypothetical protein